MIKRRKTKIIKVGNVLIGANQPIVIQSMAKTDTKNIAATVRGIKEAQKEGCRLIRVAVKDQASVSAIKEIKRQISIPLIADIHFDYRLALKAIQAGVDKIRLNPGNIYKKSEVASIVSCAKERDIPIRVGVNSGSLRKGLSSLVRSALDYIKMLEKMRFSNLVISLKSSDLIETLEANRKISSLLQYPLHLGVTATGLPEIGFVKSAICLGMLLSEGIGDTIRVSLTNSPVQEVKAAKKILAALGLDNQIDVIACPTCGRCQVDLVKIVKDLEQKILKLPSGAPPNKRPLRVAVMGCVVNGPGEARCADIGIAFGKEEGLFFKNGKPIKKVSQEGATAFLFNEIKKILTPA